MAAGECELHDVNVNVNDEEDEDEDDRQQYAWEAVRYTLSYDDVNFMMFFVVSKI